MFQRLRKLAFTPAFVVACALACGAAAHAAGLEPAPKIDDIVVRLGAESFAGREAASDELRDAELDLKTIFDVLKRPGLTLEQRTRLEAAAWYPFEQSPRAGLGVSFDRNTVEGEVRIIGTVDRPGFHAHEALKPYDTVRELAGLPVYTQEQARSVILSHDPGESIDVLVIRQGVPVRAQIRLGSFLNLDGGLPANLGRMNVPAGDLRAAFAVRVLREMGDHEKQSGAAAIDAGFDRETWDGLYRKVQQIRNRQYEKDAKGTLATVPTLRAGGVPRAQAMDVVNQPVRRGGGYQFNTDKNELLNAIRKHKLLVQEKLLFIDQAKLVMERPDIPAVMREQMLRQVEMALTQVEENQDQIRKLQELLNGR